MLVVTGASGLLGASVLKSAADLGWKTVGLCHRHVLQNPAVPTIGIDLTDQSATRRLLFELQPDAILHCAAVTNVDWCEENPRQAMAINATASGFLADIASALKARFLYVSTDAVFDGKKGNYVETDAPNPLNVYADSKLAGEQETQCRNPLAIIARVTIYGWNAQNKDSLAEWILKKLEQGEDIAGFTDVFFTPILVNDLSPFLLAMLQQRLTGLYHVAGSERISKFEFAKRVSTTFGFDVERIKPCRVQDVKLRAARPLDASLNTEKIRQSLGHMMPDVDSGLRTFRELRLHQYPHQLKSYLVSERME